MNVAAIVIFVIIFIAIYKLGITFSSSDKRSRQRISELLESGDEGIVLEEEYAQETPSGAAAAMEALVKPFRDVEREKNNLRFELMRAGWTSPNAVAYYLFFSTFGWLIAIIAFVALFYPIASLNKGSAFYLILLLGFLNCAFIALAAPLMLNHAVAKRKRLLVRSFPDALDLLLVCVESGLALDASLMRVCKELKFAHPEITKEFNKTRLELTMLNDRERALQNLATRTDLFAFKSLVAALLQSEKYGTSLVDTLRVLSDDYRQTRMSLAEEAAGKLPTKITVASIPFMILALMILVASPAIIGLMTTWK